MGRARATHRPRRSRALKPKPSPLELPEGWATAQRSAGLGPVSALGVAENTRDTIGSIMSLQHRPLESITASDLQQLIDTGARENVAVDYKQTWSVQSDDQKREFLYDVASLANTLGGDLIYGIRAADGVPTELLGVPSLVPDKEQLTAENLLRTCISPRLPRIGFHVVALPNGNSAWIVRVPRGLSQPHHVRHGSFSRFYGRNSAGKYELDVFEIRRAFVASEGVLDRLRDFRLQRINRIVANDTGHTYLKERRLVLHVLPVETVLDELRFSISELRKAAQDLQPFGQIAGYGPQVNFDGLAILSRSAQQHVMSSLQLFRNGAIEVVDVTCLASFQNEPLLHATRMEQSVRDGFPSLLAYMQRLGLGPPFVVALSLLSVKGTTIYLDPQYYGNALIPIQQDNLVLPGTTIEELPADVDKVFRPTFDLVWNASGLASSINYQADGTWKPRN